MYPVLFDIAGFKLYSFGLMVALAFVIGFWWIFQRARAVGEDPNLYLDASCWIIIAALVGARLCYVLFFPELFMADPLGTLFGQGGLVWYGGMAGVTLAIILYTRIKKINLWRFSDIFIPPAALGLAIGRLGCLLAGCCFGGPCAVSWLAIHYPADHPSHGAGLYPTPLLESIAMAAAAFFLARLSKRQQFPGQTTWSFFIIYGLVRFLLEYLRGDRLVWIAALNLSASQVISLLGILIGFVMLGLLGRQSNHNKPSLTTGIPHD